MWDLVLLLLWYTFSFFNISFNPEDDEERFQNL